MLRWLTISVTTARRLRGTAANCRNGRPAIRICGRAFWIGCVLRAGKVWPNRGGKRLSILSGRFPCMSNANPATAKAMSHAAPAKDRGGIGALNAAVRGSVPSRCRNTTITTNIRVCGLCIKAVPTVRATGFRTCGSCSGSGREKCGNCSGYGFFTRVRAIQELAVPSYEVAADTRFSPQALSDLLARSGAEFCGEKIPFDLNGEQAGEKTHGMSMLVSAPPSCCRSG